MSALTYKKNDDLESGTLDKMTVFQDCISGFNSSPINAKKCRLLLAKLVHLISTGETFPPEEATSLFFSITKLFQHKDAALRQMVYLAIKELSSVAEDVIMVTSSIMKDIQSSSDIIYKPNAIRALCRIIDASIVQGIERLMKTAIVDKHPSVSSAALISSYHLIPVARDVIRRWANETQEAVTAVKQFPSNALSSNYSPGVSTMTQYHAIGLLYQLRAHDRMALMKMIQQFGGSNSPVRNSNAIVMLIRYIARIIEDDPNLRTPLMPYLSGWLKNRSDIVSLEAAKIILAIKDLPDTEAVATVAVLQSFLGSPRTISRFAAIRILNRYAMIRPQNVASCNLEIEGLINDSSRIIATYAITTLLKTGNETSVDRLMSQISGFMNDISDDSKIIVVDAIRSLALKFPAKYPSMLSFLAGTLRDEGGITFKTAVVEALFDMIRYIPASRDAALGHLSELVEDCEFTELSVRILHLLSEEGPKTAAPTLYIRYIYNRVVLENAVIRAAAVSALAKFALVDDESVRKSVVVLLKRCLDDVTDEVRDRAAFSLRLIGLGNEVAYGYLNPKEKFSLPQLEHQLAIYVSGDKSVFEIPFNISNVPVITDEQARAEALKQKSNKLITEEPTSKPDISSAAETGPSTPAERELQKEITAQEYVKALASVPEFQTYGKLLKSSNAVPLTESETEYVVTAVKHLFKDHLVIQYDVTNTFSEYVLENVLVDVQGDLEEDFIIPIDKLVPDSTGKIYVSFTRPEGEFTTTTFYNNLKFVSKEIDPETKEVQEEGYDDDYSLENLNLVVGDYLVPTYVGNFAHQWDELSHEATETYQLSAVESLEEATASIISELSLLPLEGSDTVPQSASHLLKLFGRTINGDRVIGQVKMVYSSRNGVTLKITVRSDHDEVSKLVAEDIGRV